ncbi:ATP-grasp domain-containing protein [Pilimelia anulata]|uniref:ATP-grasp domain-containing protein n=1 Tax=Pilimelia anulata TaxID=53371 RepID=A0A8J3B894_9ACTN|nr:hypothetical protein [Pilimelia anulata]GGK02749.1 ATP-grasp domain-containing protein [Pilimelia anulata]
MPTAPHPPTAVVLASCARCPAGDGDEAALPGLLAARGVPARWQPWDAGPPPPGALVVLRATWDYTDRPADFLAWAAAVPRLANPYPVLRRNTDKRYLLRLAAAGVPVVPTAVREPGEPLGPVAGPIVVKPAVGAGARGAGRFDPATADAAAAHLRALHAAGRAALVQPYQPAVDAEGETALVFVGGRYSHAFTKGAMLSVGPGDPAGGELYRSERLAPVGAAPALVAFARRCLDAAAADAGVAVADLLYGRVDVVRGPAGPLVLEVELTEPSLGFRQADPARLAAFADAIAARISG